MRLRFNYYNDGNKISALLFSDQVEYEDNHIFIYESDYYFESVKEITESHAQSIFRDIVKQGYYDFDFGYIDFLQKDYE